MLKRSNRWGASLFPILGIILTLACNTLAPATANPPSVLATQEKIQVTSTLPPPSAAPQPTLRPTNPPAPPPTFTKIPEFPTNTGLEIGDLTDACTLIRMEEVAVLFPKPPQPANELKKERGYTASSCTYNDGSMSLSISIAASPDFVDSLAEHIANIKSFPLFKQFSASGAEIYQVGAGDKNSHADAFAGIIIKNNTAVEVVGTGKAYVYHTERETLFLKAIASRLPPETTIFNACNLVTLDEVAARFPNPPAPTPELQKYDGYSATSCTFQDNNMKLIIMVGQAQPGDVAGLTENMHNVMKELPVIINYSAYGADIYQWGGSNDETDIGDVLAAILIKEPNILQIEAQGAFYQYNANRETTWIQTIASRLP